MVSIFAAAIRCGFGHQSRKNQHKSEPFLFDHDLIKASYMAISFNSLEKLVHIVLLIRTVRISIVIVIVCIVLVIACISLRSIFYVLNNDVLC